MVTPDHLALYFVAARLMPGVKHLGASKETCKESFTLLAGHAAECFLKAIASKPYDDPTVALPSLMGRDVRHNLQALWELASARCSMIEVTAPAWLSALDQFHDAPYVIRYMRGVNAYSLPPHKQVLTGLRRLSACTKAFLGLP